jgi:hypothetical protein
MPAFLYFILAVFFARSQSNFPYFRMDREVGGAQMSSEEAAFSKERLVDALILRGAQNIPHSGRTFLEHLVGTYDLLESWGADPSVCRAGLFHSIYGTEIFDAGFDPPWTRAEVAKLIGPRAEKLAFLFCNVRRAALREFSKAFPDAAPDILLGRRPNTAIRITRSILKDLVQIYLANNEEQRQAHIGQG